MSTRFIFLSFILISSQVHAMKRLVTKITSKVPTCENLENHQLYIPDIEYIITDYAMNYLLSKKPRETTQTINTLALTNKKLNSIINTPTFSDNLIKNLSHKLFCSHETIARLLSTKQSTKRLDLQLELKDLCCRSYIYMSSNVNYSTNITFNRLITQGINLEFTYNDRELQSTPLMLSTHYNNNMFNVLLENKANINTCNSYGLPLLKLVSNQPINLVHFMAIIKRPELQVNQQNRHGETALLRCLVRRQYRVISDLFITVITELLNAGADPKLGNKYGVTPLIAAQQLKDERVINLIAQAIKKTNPT